MLACRTLWGRGGWIGGAGVGLVAWLIVQLPGIAHACAVCSAGRDDENAAAFLISTIFMSLLPLIAVGTIVYLLFRRIRKFEAEKEARRAAAASRGISATASSVPAELI